MRTLEELRAGLRALPEGRCLLGLSGGADSVALLHLLLPLQEQAGFRLEAAHVNHGLRGAESDGDEEFVRQLCREKGVPAHFLRVDLGGRRDENSAREARYQALFGLMEREEIPTLVLAHQRDDQAETFLMRLLRGAGPEGLGGMRARERRGEFLLLRPMLDLSGRELRETLREAGIAWREDGSNRDPAYLRNRIRGELMPCLEALASGAGERIARTAELIGLENDAAEPLGEELLRRCETPAGLETEPLEEAAEAIRRRALRTWWRLRGPKLAERELNYSQTLRLEGLLKAPRGTIINLPGGWRARREKRHIRLLAPGDRTRNNRPGRNERKEKEKAK